MFQPIQLSIHFRFCSPLYRSLSCLSNLSFFYKKKRFLIPSDKSVKISLWGLFLVPIVFIPITFFSYLTHSYVFATIILTLFFTAFGEKIEITKLLSQYVNSIVPESAAPKRSYLLYLQILIFIFIAIYLTGLPSPIAPEEMSFLYLALLSIAIMITWYMVVTNSKLKEISIVLSALFLSLFLAIQGSVYFGGDSGFFISITKYLLNGNVANFISPGDRWRFGSATMLGFPSLGSYLSEISQANPEFAISFANALSILFIFMGGYMFSRFFDGTNVKKCIILIIYTLGQPAIYFHTVNTFRSMSFLLLILPLTIPLFSRLNFNKYGKLSFVVAMFSIGVIHPLSFISIITMTAYLFTKSLVKEKIAILGLLIALLAMLAKTPRYLRSLSISTEGLPSLKFTNKINDFFYAPFPSFSSPAWPGIFMSKFDLTITLITFLTLLFVRVKNIPRIPLLVFIGVFFVTSSFIKSNLFPIERLSIFITSVGLVILTALIIDYLYNHKFIINKNLRKIILVSLLSVVIMGVIVNSYPKGRSLSLDTYDVSEHRLLSDFVKEEKSNFNNSLILAHIETLRYLNGIDGSLLFYNNAPKAFHFDFTDPGTSRRLYAAFSASLTGNFSSAINLAAQNHVRFIYVVLIHRVVPNAVDYGYGTIVVQNEAGTVRKISLT